MYLHSIDTRIRVMKENGFKDVEVAFTPLDTNTSEYFHELIANGYHFITARK